MRLNTVTPQYHSATRRSFVATQDDTGQIIREYYDNGVIQMRFISSNVGKTVIYTYADLEPEERLVNIVDRSGNPIIEDETYKVVKKYANVNSLGWSDGFSYQIARLPK